jgi:aminocarboxymuconate-semialdehyde decarboxylase
MLSGGCSICEAVAVNRRRVMAMATPARAGKPSDDTSRSPPRIKAGAVSDAIDFHAHLLEPSLIPPGGEPSIAHRIGWAERLTQPLRQIADMESRGINRHVVGYSNVIQGISWGDARTDLAIYKRMNDRLAESWVNAHPGRFFGAIGLPTQNLNLALPELERAVVELGHRVLQISSATADGTYYGDPQLHPLWEAVQHFGVTVFIHPHGQANAPPLDRFALQNSVGQSIEEAKVMSSIIYEGIFDKYPGVKILMAHGGGFLPHYYGRVDRNVTNFPTSTVNISRYPSDYLREFYYDSCVYSPDVMAALVKVVGTDRIVLGGDYPVGLDDPVSALKSTPGLADIDIDKILNHTPRALLEAPLSA